MIHPVGYVSAQHNTTIREFEEYFRQAEKPSLSIHIKEHKKYLKPPTNPFRSSANFAPPSMEVENHFCLDYVSENQFSFLREIHFADLDANNWDRSMAKVFYKGDSYRIIHDTEDFISKSKVDADLTRPELVPIVADLFLTCPAISPFKLSSGKLRIEGDYRHLELIDVDKSTAILTYRVQAGELYFDSYKGFSTVKNRIKYQVRALKHEKINNRNLTSEWEDLYFEKENELETQSILKASFGESCNIIETTDKGRPVFTRTAKGIKEEYRMEDGKIIPYDEAARLIHNKSVTQSETNWFWLVGVGVLVFALLLIVMKRLNARSIK